MIPQEVWATVKVQLQMQMDRGSYETWVKRTEFIAYDADTATFVLGAPNSYICEMLQTRLYPKFRRMLSDTAGNAVLARFEIVREAEVTPPSDDMPLLRYAASTETTLDAPSMEELVRTPRHSGLPDSELNARYTFERFIVSPHNEMVYQAAQAIAESPGTMYNPFFMYGGVGLGKTHLLQAIGHACLQRGKKVLYVSSEVFVSEFITAIRNRTNAMFQQRYRTVDVLLIDDVQFFMGKESSQDEFFHTYNALTQWNKQIVLVSDRHPRDLNNIDERLRSRFQGGLTTDIQAPELETRRSIVTMWMHERGVEFDTDVVTMVTQPVRSVRELEGAFRHLLARATLQGKLSVAEAQTTLNRYDQPRDRITAERIIEMTAQKSAVPAADILGKKRSEIISTTRQIAMFLCRELTDLSLSQIGNAFGRSHTTILHACNKVTADIAASPAFRARVDKIRKALKG